MTKSEALNYLEQCKKTGEIHYKDLRACQLALRSREKVNNFVKKNKIQIIVKL